MQDCSISIANALEILKSWSKPSIYVAIHSVTIISLELITQATGTWLSCYAHNIMAITLSEFRSENEKSIEFEFRVKYLKWNGTLDRDD